MSKGPGKLQRAILSKLDEQEAFSLHELLGESFTRVEYIALHHAMRILEDAGKIKVARSRFGVVRQYVHHIGTTFTGEDRIQYDVYHSSNGTNALSSFLAGKWIARP